MWQAPRNFFVKSQNVENPDLSLDHLKIFSSNPLGALQKIY
jgi:hypothetical protein